MNKPLLLATGLFAACTDASAKIEKKLSDHEKRIVALEKAKPRGRPRPGPDLRKYDIPVASTDPSLGPKNARVTLVEASEFACPYCARLAPVVEQVAQRFEGKVRWVPKHFVVHPNIATDAALSVCAANRMGQLQAYKKALWKSAWGSDGRRLDREALRPPALTALAAKHQMDPKAFSRTMKSSECKDELQRHRREMQAARVTGTPTLFINGVKYVGPRTVEAVSARVQKILGS